MLNGFGQGINTQPTPGNINPYQQFTQPAPAIGMANPYSDPFVQQATPFRPTLPVNTTSTQANAVLDPYQGQTLNFDSKRDMNNFQKQQRYITDPTQQYVNQNLIRQMGRDIGLRGNEAQQYMQNNYSMLPTTFQRYAPKIGEYTAIAKPKNAFYQMNPMGGIRNLLG